LLLARGARLLPRVERPARLAEEREVALEDARPEVAPLDEIGERRARREEAQLRGRPHPRPRPEPRPELALERVEARLRLRLLGPRAEEPALGRGALRLGVARGLDRRRERVLGVLDRLEERPLARGEGAHGGLLRGAPRLERLELRARIGAEREAQRRDERERRGHAGSAPPQLARDCER